MILQDRERFHQLHWAKLLVDWGTAIAAGGFFWMHEPLAGAMVGFGPSILITLVFLSGRLDPALERVRSRPAAAAMGPKLSADVNALRFGGLALAWGGCWMHRGWLPPAGVVVILGAWWMAWRRGAATRGDVAGRGSRH